MRVLISLMAMTMMSAVASAQSAPPMVGDKPLVQVRPKGGAAKPKPNALAAKLQECLAIEDGSKERLDCYDAVIAPKPAAGKRKLPPAKAVADCRLVKEQDERLSCFNGFAERLPKS